jgi:hypothetical protein
MRNMLTIEIVVSKKIGEMLLQSHAIKRLENVMGRRPLLVGT